MRTISFFLFLLLISCSPSGDKKSGSVKSDQTVTTADVLSSFEGQAAVLLQQLRDQGDYVNSRQYPSMIKTATVFEELEMNNLIIDIRSAEGFEKGHIEGAVNVGMDQLLHLFENDILPFKYNKIIIVCNGGQRSSYVTNLLRLLGYGNVYSMRWGMAGWNSDFSGYLYERFLSSDYQDSLVTESPERPASNNQPVFESEATSGEELLKERVAALLAINPKEIFIKTPELFEDTEKYFIINFERKDKYESGHILGAHRYKQEGTLGIPSVMGTFPTDRTIVLYCGTGMSSSFAIAYLRLFGYDARSLSYGTNSFMHQKMLDEKESLSWQPFTDEIPGEFPYVKGN